MNAFNKYVKGVLTEMNEDANVLTRPDQTRPDQTTHVRNSSLELLRIIAMLLIISSHFSLHGGFDLSDTSVISVNKLWFQSMLTGNYGNNIFVLMSGWFLVNSTAFKFSKALNLWLKIAFYGILLFCLSIMTGIISFTSKDIITFIQHCSGGWWFAGCYFTLYIFHPFINILLHSMTKHEYRNMLGTMFICWSIVPTFLRMDFWGNNFTWFVFMYSLAGYFKIWANDFISKKYILVGVLIMLLNVFTILMFDVIGLKYPYFGIHSRGFFSMHSPTTAAASLAFVIGFAGLNIEYSRYINALASAAFGVYLLHLNPLVNHLLWKVLFNAGTYQKSLCLIPYTTAVTLTIYISCALIDLVRSKIFKTLFHGKLS